ncbi:MAG: thiamine pyrophosphate-binding protein [Planctomycetota bacterium]
MKVKVSDLMADFLARKKVRHVFGIVGAGNAHLFDSVYAKGATEIVCVHHEQAACMAAQTYFRVSGVVTAALVTTGGGSTNATTGVVSAWMDSIPILVISGNENSKFTREDNPLRIWGVQGYDSSGTMEKVTKYAVRVTEPLDVIFELEKAHAIASSGRPGPCWVDVPMNVQSALVEEADVRHHEPEAAPPAPPLGPAIAQVAALLRAAERPLLWLGHGVRLAGATDLVPALLESLQVPALVSWAGIDMVDSAHPLVYGRAGVYGQRAANFVLQNCDLVLAIGTRLAIPQVGYDVTELARGAKIAVVDLDPAELAKYSERYALTVRSDAGDFLRALLESRRGAPPERRPAWIERCDEWRRRFPWVGPEHPDRDGFLNSYAFMERLNAHLKPDQIVVTDMGTALLSGHQVLRMKPPQRLMTSTGLGEMGYGLPAALGASFARDRGEVLCLNCDGGMMMNLQELQTLVHHELPIKLIIFDNDGYLMIKHTQKALFKGRYSGTDRKSGVSCPDFSKLAAAFGIPSYRIRTWEDFERVIPEVQRAERSVICEVFMHPEQPLVPKLSLAVKDDGTLVSPPLEDLSPLLPRDELARNMPIGLHPKSKDLKT